MTPNDVVIKNWNHFTRLAANMHGARSPFSPTFIFRGLPADFALRSSLLRALGDGISTEAALFTERRLVSEFQAQAHLHLAASPLPHASDSVAWRALMQHHGVPTRLLDWTASVFVALYFAVSDAWMEDGIVWVLASSRLMRTREVLSFTSSDFIKELGNPEANPAVIATVPTIRSDRMVAQQGHFTFCMNLLGDQQTQLAVAFGAEPQRRASFGRMIIPKQLKPEFLLHLRAMNVTAAALFPGVDGLGRSLSEAAKLHGEVVRNHALLQRGLLADTEQLLAENRANKPP